MEACLTTFGGKLEVIRTDAADVAVTLSGIVERLNIVSHVKSFPLASVVDLLLDALFLETGEKDSATALFQQLPLRLMLGSSQFFRQNRCQSSLPY